MSLIIYFLYLYVYFDIPSGLSYRIKLSSYFCSLFFEAEQPFPGRTDRGRPFFLSGLLVLQDCSLIVDQLKGFWLSPPFTSALAMADLRDPTKCQ